MKWEKVLKIQGLKNITGILPKVDSPESEDDGPCKRRLKEMAKFWRKHGKEQTEKGAYSSRTKAEVEVKDFLTNVKERVCCKMLENIIFAQGHAGPYIDTYENTEMVISQGARGASLYMGKKNPGAFYFEIDIDLKTEDLDLSNDIYDYMVRQAKGEV